MMNYVLSPSILAADFKVLGQEMKKTEENGAAYIHFDVMDGMFVPSISFGMPVLASINDATEQFMDAHLMVQEPIRYVEAFQKAGADYVTVHLEACEDVKTTLDKIHACGMKAGLAVNPETDVKELVPYLEDVEMILIMSVHTSTTYKPYALQVLSLGCSPLLFPEGCFLSILRQSSPCLVSLVELCPCPHSLFQG